MDRGGKWRYLMGDNWEKAWRKMCFHSKENWQQHQTASCSTSEIFYFLSNRKLFFFVQCFFSTIGCYLHRGLYPSPLHSHTFLHLLLLASWVEPPPRLSSSTRGRGGRECVLPAQRERFVSRAAEENWLTRVVGWRWSKGKICAHGSWMHLCSIRLTLMTSSVPFDKNTVSKICCSSHHSTYRATTQEAGAEVRMQPSTAAASLRPSPWKQTDRNGKQPGLEGVSSVGGLIGHTSGGKPSFRSAILAEG